VILEGTRNEVPLQPRLRRLEGLNHSCGYCLDRYRKYYEVVPVSIWRTSGTNLGSLGLGSSWCWGDIRYKAWRVR